MFQYCESYLRLTTLWFSYVNMLDMNKRMLKNKIQNDQVKKKFNYTFSDLVLPFVIFVSTPCQIRFYSILYLVLPFFILVFTLFQIFFYLFSDSFLLFFRFVFTSFQICFYPLSDSFLLFVGLVLTNPMLFLYLRS